MKKSIVTLLALMCILTVGCSSWQMQLKSPHQILAETAVIVGAKMLGQKMQGSFEWTPEVQRYFDAIQGSGVSLDTAKMGEAWMKENISPLYYKEVRQMLTIASFKYDASGELIDVSGADWGLVGTAFDGFREGLFYRP